MIGHLGPRSNPRKMCSALLIDSATPVRGRIRRPNSWHAAASDNIKIRMFPRLLILVDNRMLAASAHSMSSHDVSCANELEGVPLKLKGCAERGLMVGTFCGADFVEKSVGKVVGGSHSRSRVIADSIVDDRLVQSEEDLGTGHKSRPDCHIQAIARTGIPALLAFESGISIENEVLLPNRGPFNGSLLTPCWVLSVKLSGSISRSTSLTGEESVRDHPQFPTSVLNPAWFDETHHPASASLEVTPGPRKAPTGLPSGIKPQAKTKGWSIKWRPTDPLQFATPCGNLSEREASSSLPFSIALPAKTTRRPTARRRIAYGSCGSSYCRKLTHEMLPCASTSKSEATAFVTTVTDIPETFERS